MKYTTTIREAQFAGDVRLSPQGGTITEEQAKAIASDPWGKKLLETGWLKFDKDVEIPVAPKLGMTVSGAVRGSARPKTESGKH